MFDCLLDNNPTSVIFNSLCVEDEGTCHTELDGLRPTRGGLNDNFVFAEPFSQLSPHKHLYTDGLQTKITKKTFSRQKPAEPPLGVPVGIAALAQSSNFQI